MKKKAQQQSDVRKELLQLIKKNWYSQEALTDAILAAGYTKKWTPQTWAEYGLKSGLVTYGEA